ncbi:hypothetical protein AAFF_G00275810 [Aldrovandia affinis]|uniref:Uncharacterized protein n=1 Tax=Aldrovandia affinis TaxID=143900 RepID=A0AAD7W1G3_9TELE|nr:hypothetical protein AAFF_G00275810 [Aldrovandia affinis]
MTASLRSGGYRRKCWCETADAFFTPASLTCRPRPRFTARVRGTFRHSVRETGPAGWGHIPHLRPRTPAGRTGSGTLVETTACALAVTMAGVHFHLSRLRRAS